MRVFIAVNLPDDLKNHVKAFSKQLKSLYPHHHIVWVDPSVYHITLEFLGELSCESVKTLKNTVEEIMRKYQGRKVVVELFKYCIFPSIKKPRLLMIKARNKSDTRLNSIQYNIHNALMNKGFEIQNKKWLPHVTLGRVKDRGARFHTNQPKFEAIQFNIESIDLMSSELSSEGQKYKVIQKFDF